MKRLTPLCLIIGCSCSAPLPTQPKAGIAIHLTAVQRVATGNEVRPCWEASSRSSQTTIQMHVRVVVQTDTAGTVRSAFVAPADQRQIEDDPAFRSFAERAIRAIMDPRCATLPLPDSLNGSPQTLTFRFSP
jgi:hypothetical protein